MGSDWRTFSDWAINQALKYPAYATYVVRNDTYVYKTQVQIRDSRDKLRGTVYVNVVVARKSQNIITAYPSSK